MSDDYKYVEKPKPKSTEYDNAMDEASRRQPKTEKSEFDRVLEKSKLTQQSSDSVKVKPDTVQERAVEESQRHRDKEEEGKKDDSDEKGSKKKDSGERRDSQGLLENRVHGKASKGQGGGAGGDGREGFGYGRGRRASVDKIKNLSKEKVQKEGVEAKFARELKEALKQGEVRAPKTLNQDLLNQIVNGVKVGINAKGENEMKIDLKEKVFRGLRLRVAEKNGKVKVHFLTAGRDVKELFENESGKIKSALLEKGIDVVEILVS